MKPMLLGKYAAYRPPTHDVFSVGSIGYEQDGARKRAVGSIFNKRNAAGLAGGAATAYGAHKLLSAVGRPSVPVALGAGLYAGYRARKAMGSE